MVEGKLAQNVRNKFFEDFEKLVVQEKDELGDGRLSPAVESMLCGFILEGEDSDFRAPASVDQDWFYKL
ncbi:MAG: hypothetical protein K2Z81_17770 [Cyanobacteria bacterium]|nr:hypothetical protein [Cyanobacteriota bacterium]